MEIILNFFNSIDWSREWLGIIATIITLYSFSIRHSLQFRQVNIIAAIMWITYGFMLSSSAVIITNGVITIMHIYHLYNHYYRNILLECKYKSKNEKPA